MILYTEAIDIVLNTAIPLTSESISLPDSCGRILANDIVSDVDMPPFNKSAMDGYACRRVDTISPMKCVGIIGAGQVSDLTIEDGECIKIMTGAPVPIKADCVVMVEHTKESNGMITVKKDRSNNNICFKAEDVVLGDIVLTKGTLIKPAHIAVLASVGRNLVLVSKKPCIAVLATGSELVEPSRKPETAQIRNSNSYQLCSQVMQAGAKPIYFGILKDHEDVIKKTIDEATKNCNIILLSGGVSMGDYDHVPGVLKDLGFDLLFEKVAIKPGKPTVFGRRGDTFVFGLPGNPVSTYMIFELFVRPFICKMMGHNYRPKKILGTLSETIKRKRIGRLAHIPIHIDEDNNVYKILYHGSGHIHSLIQANGFITIAENRTELVKGDKISVTLFS